MLYEKINNIVRTVTILKWQLRDYWKNPNFSYKRKNKFEKRGNNEINEHKKY